MTQAIYVQWSDDGQHIRKWSREPFEGAEAFIRHQSGRTGAGEALREAARLVFEAWDAHVTANDRTNAAIPAIDATRAEREVYDERYRASEEAKREWYRSMYRFIETPGLRAALSQSTAGEALVPINTTPAMRQAGADQLFGAFNDDWADDADAIWKAMIAAALAQPVEAGEDGT